MSVGAILLPAAVLVTVLVTLTLFAYVLYLSYNPKAVHWNRLNGFVALTLVLTLVSIGAQFLLDRGLSATACATVQHVAGTSFNLTNGLSRTFFVIRSNSVLPAGGRAHKLLGRALVVVVVVLVVVGLIGYNANLEVALLDGYCATVLRPSPPLFISLLVPFLIAAVVNVRFVWVVRQVARQASRRTSSSLTTTTTTPVTSRLLRITCAMSLLTLASFAFELLFLFGLIPIADPTLASPIYVTLQMIDACSMAWPVIVIQLTKVYRAAGAAGILAPKRWSRVPFAADSVQTRTGGGPTPHGPPSTDI